MNANPLKPGETSRQRRNQIDSDWKAQLQQRTDVRDDKPAEPLFWTEMAVQEVHHDYLECKLVANGATYGVNIKVAKDPGLRKSIYHDRTIDGLLYDYTDVQARTVTKLAEQGPFGPNGQDESKDQVIIPKYLVPSDEDGDDTPEGQLPFTGSIITAAPIATDVQDDAGNPLKCQYREYSNRAYAIDEEAS